MTPIEAKVRELVAANPSFRYTQRGDDVIGCSYFPDEHNPQGCLMGAALTALGTTENELHLLEDFSGTTAGITGIVEFEELLERAGLDYDLYADDPEIRWLGRVQEGQDQGLTWAQAVAFADDTNNNEGYQSPFEWLFNQREEQT